MSLKRHVVIAAIGAALMLGAATSASAGTWNADHPRRAEVNGRLANQNYRIDRDYRDGMITAGQAQALHSEDRAVRNQERFDASFRNGHITSAQQRALNQDENGVSRQIYRDAH
ncbi:MAG: hypothetical protein ABSC92_07495 [Rhizomicrobium sp.]|jgi:hypothetical protein